MEVLVTTAAASGGESNEAKTSLIFWNPINGTKLLSLRGMSSIAQQHSLSFIKNEGILIAEVDKPFLHYWQCGASLQNSSRILCPGKPGPTTISPTGHFIVVGISDQILVWQVETGRIVNVVNSAHFRPITILKFTNDGSFLLSASQDGIVHVWSFLQLASKINTPVYSWSHHSLSVTGVHVSGTGIGKKSYAFTVSLDRTMKMYSLTRLTTGDLLLSIAFPIPLTSIVVDHCDTRVYIGTTSGNIYQCKLTTLPRNAIEHHIGAEETTSCSVFKKHTSPISCLTVSADGLTLASGDESGNIFLWDTQSGQPTKTIVATSSGATTTTNNSSSKVTNMQFWVGYPENWKSGLQKPTIVFPEVAKLIESQDQQQERHELEHIVTVWNRVTTSADDNMAQKNSTNADSDRQKTIEIANLKSQLARAESINRKLHEFCVQNILHANDNENESESEAST